MAVDYTKYLAGAIITEDKIVTYRLLSRTLKVHHSEAKRMLYEFHRQQNAKKPGSIHATYLVAGVQLLATPAAESSQNGSTDLPMPSSPYMSSAPAPGTNEEVEPVRQRVLTLAKEENLEAVKSKYESVSSVHIYSLGPSSLRNMEMLSAVTQRIMTEFIAEDPLIHNKKYGVIQNSSVKRRSSSRPIPQPLPIKEETKAVFSKSKDPKTAEGNKTLTKSKAAAPGSGEQATKVGAPSLIKRESSDLFKSFAKAKPKVKPEAKPAKTEDVPMKDASDDDEEASSLAEIDAESEARRKTRLEQKEKMRKWMEEEDEDEDENADDDGAQPMEGVKSTGPASQTEPEAEAETAAEDTAKEEEDDDQPSAPIDAPVPKNESGQQDDDEAAAPVTVSGGRRRGRRKVMKKKTTRDAEGYLVTKEEAVWESFSEDDTPAPSTKPKSTAGAAAAAKAKKGPGKPGQGNIMTFFGKK